MASMVFKKRLFFSTFFLFGILLLGQASMQEGFEEIDGDKQAIWKLLETAVRPNENSEEYDEDYGEDGEYEGEEMSEELKEFEERNSVHLETRAVVHKVCKVQTTPVRLGFDGYEYSTNYYKNLTCEETADKPLERKTSHSSEYCLILHHPHERVACQTKHIRVPLFRRKNHRHHWEKIIETVAVGCDCSVGLKYL